MFPCEIGLDDLFHLAGINSLGKMFSCLLMPGPGIFERNFRKYTKGKEFLLSPKSIFEPPTLRPFGGNLQKKPPTIEELLRFSVGLAFEIVIFVSFMGVTISPVY